MKIDYDDGLDWMLKNLVIFTIGFVVATLIILFS